MELPDALSQDEARLLLASKLYELSKVSLGDAARIAGYSKRAFMEALGRLHIAVINYSAEELREELGR